MNLLTYLDGSTNQDNKVLLYDLFAGIGDQLWRSTLYKELKRRNPKLKLIVCGQGQNFKLIFKDNPYIDLLIDREGQPPYGQKIDYYVSDLVCPHIMANYSHKMDAIDALEIWSGLTIYDKSYVYKVTKEENEFAEKFISKLPKPIIGVVLKSSTWVRTWPIINTKKLIKHILYNKGSVIIFDNMQSVDLQHERIINMAGGYNIREVAAVISKLDGMIAPDSGLLHFAGHFKIPTIGLFGAVPSLCRTKYYSTVVPLEINLPCRPCFIHNFACKYGIPSPCMAGISVESVLNVLNKFNIFNKEIR